MDRRVDIGVFYKMGRIVGHAVELKKDHNLTIEDILCGYDLFHR